MTATTDRRNNSVLHSIISRYIETAEPVGSKLISELLSQKEGLNASPATIRNTMAELEAEGFIEKPHCSAGRVPTVKAFRRYIDAVLTINEPFNNTNNSLLNNFADIKTGSSDIMYNAAHLLSDITHCTGIVITESKEFIIKHIRLYQVDSEQIMLVALSTDDETFSKVTQVGKTKSKLNFETMTNYLNMLGAGLTLQGLKIKILKEIKEDKAKYDNLVSKTWELGSLALAGIESLFARELLLDATSNIFDQPEYRADIDKMRMLHKTFEEKNMILKLLDKKILKNETTVLMGSESNIEELKGLSFITTPYHKDGVSAGTLGVVGPMRMNYLSIIPLVRQTARLIEQ